MLQAQSVPMFCVGNFGFPNAGVRGQGVTELTNDYTASCTGGTPTPAGQTLPVFNFTLFFNTNVTSRITAGNLFTEALLIIDNPVSIFNPTKPMLNCGNADAPDNGPAGPGICSIRSTGNPMTNYDGTQNGYGSALCDGSTGNPVAGTYGCGRPNVFQGRLGTPSNPGQANAITFYNVPLDPPGLSQNGGRSLRFTNLRVNGTPFNQTVDYSKPYPGAGGIVFATLLPDGPFPITIEFGKQTVASGGYPYFPCDSGNPLKVRVCFSTRPKNLSFTVGGRNGVNGNATINDSVACSYNYNGGMNYPPDVAQNVPEINQFYCSESGFEWQNNAANAPPFPNPPDAYFLNIKVTQTNFPLLSIGAGGLNTRIDSAGVADSGTRVAITFLGIPAGASVQVPPVVYLFTSSPPLDTTTYTAGAAGVLVLTTTDAVGAGPFTGAAGTLTATNNIAVYECLWGSGTTDVPYTITNAPIGTTLQTSVVMAPFYSDPIALQASSNLPVPRFSPNACSSVRCIGMDNATGANIGPVQLTFAGVPDLTGATVLLRRQGATDIGGTNFSYLTNQTPVGIKATFDLTNAPIGSWDVVFELATGPAITLPGEFSVVATPTCSYDGPGAAYNFPPSGGTGNFSIVLSPSTCAWSVANYTDWITILPKSADAPNVQPFSVAANAAPIQRIGTFETPVGLVQINQDGTQSAVTRVGSFRSGFFWLEDVDGNQQFNAPPDRAFAFGGIAGDIPIAGDWNGSGTTKVGVYRPSNGLFVLDYDGDGQFTAREQSLQLRRGNAGWRRSSSW